MEVFELLTVQKDTSQLLSTSISMGGEERTKIDSIYFAVNDDRCTLATKNVDRLINFNVVDSYSLGLLEFLQTP